MKSQMEKEMVKTLERATAAIEDSFPGYQELIPSFWEGRELYIDLKDKDGEWSRYLWMEDDDA